MKRVSQLVFLFTWALIIGLILVQLRTLRLQNVFRLTQLSEQQQRRRQAIWQQQVRITASIQNPQRVKDRVKHFELALVPPGVEPEDPFERQVAYHRDPPRIDVYPLHSPRAETQRSLDLPSRDLR